MVNLWPVILDINFDGARNIPELVWHTFSFSSWLSLDKPGREKEVNAKWVIWSRVLQLLGVEIKHSVIITRWMQVFSHVQLFVTPWTIAHQAPLSMGIIQARILERVAIPFSRGSSQPRDWTQVPCTSGRFFTVWKVSMTVFWQWKYWSQPQEAHDDFGFCKRPVWSSSFE